VLACSALRRGYRDLLRAAVPLQESFAIQLDADVRTLHARLTGRRSHYMPGSLLASQLATLEPLEEEEPGAVVDASGSVADVTASALSALSGWHGTLPAGR
jgi:gluconokinase